MKTGLLFTSLAISLVCAPARAQRTPELAPPSALVITLDMRRASHLSALGDSLAAAPQTDRVVHAGPFVRTHDQHTIDMSTTSAATAALVAGAGPHSPDEHCKKAGYTVLARHGEPVPGGGTLNPVAFANPTNVVENCGITFFAQVTGPARNQAIFIADGTGLHAIATGCGGGGGSGNPGSGVGDPTPIGGTFSGFFGGTPFAPASNAAGDVLFLADVASGSSPRGLFLYRASTQTIAKVAAVGDAAPGGGTLGFVGPGSVNVNGVVAFLACGATINDTRILRWTNGVLTSVVTTGDAVPGGGTFQTVGGESFGFADGTSIPTAPLPDINDSGSISFRGVWASNTQRALFVSTAGVHTMLVKNGDPAPGGGTWFDLQAASLNELGQLAFFADVRLSPSEFTSGWYVAGSGARKVLGFLDPVAGGECIGLAFSRNPMDTLNDDGDVVLWTTVRFPNGTEREHIVIGRANGTFDVGAKQGNPSPLGGTFGTMDAWPSFGESGCATVNSATPGSGVLSAHMLFR